MKHIKFIFLCFITQVSLSQTITDTSSTTYEQEKVNNFLSKIKQNQRVVYYPQADQIFDTIRYLNNSVDENVLQFITHDVYIFRGYTFRGFYHTKRYILGIVILDEDRFSKEIFEWRFGELYYYSLREKGETLDSQNRGNNLYPDTINRSYAVLRKLE